MNYGKISIDGGFIRLKQIKNKISIANNTAWNRDLVTNK